MTTIEDIKSKLSIVDITSSYIRLEKSGNQYKARCPFHNEKSPSFYISPTRGTYHCFGCGVSGDIFEFVQKIEHVEFKEALKMLAEKAGVELTYKRDSGEERALSFIMEESSVYYRNVLRDSIEARKYLHDRGLTDETIDEFKIGFVRNNWRDLFVHLSTKGYSIEEMKEAGLIIEAEGNKYYDRWRGRIMFPINNVYGSIVGYTGRILPAHDDGKSGKYVNSPETKLYHKSKLLFNYDRAKKHIDKSRELILAEGQMDVVMSYQSGVKNIIAVSGTAFTEDQVKMISRLVDKVILAFDNDDAGRKATDKAALMSAYGGLQVEIVSISQKDIADLVLQDRELWVKAIESKKPIIEHYAHELRNITTLSEKMLLIKSRVVPYLRAIRSPIERDFNVNTFANLSSIGVSSIREELEKNIPLEFKTNSNDSSEENISKDVANNKIEDRELEICVLERELKIKDQLMKVNHLEELDIPSEIYNRKIIELEEKQALNLSYYEDLIKSYLLGKLDKASLLIIQNTELTDEDRLAKISELNILKRKFLSSVCDISIRVVINQLV